MSACTLRQPGMNNADYLRALRQRAIAEGKCYQCRARPVRVGTRYCESCFKRSADYGKSIRYLLCQRCGADVAGLGVQHCPDCSAKISEHNAEVRAERVLDGRCTMCPNEASAGQTMCVSCLERLRLRALTARRLGGARPRKHSCSICASHGLPGLNHTKATHARYMALAKQWRSP